LAAFKKWQSISRLLLARSEDPEADQAPDLSVEVFGFKLSNPIMVAPAGVLKIFTRIESSELQEQPVLAKYHVISA
jgi:isopentenyl diphosphate isomerase/L-lactate dehydrogenase-like FMN-dependent dehydrogenase